MSDSCHTDFVKVCSDCKGYVPTALGLLMEFPTNVKSDFRI